MWHDGAMKLPKKILGQGEEVVLHMRTHVKTILPNIILAVILLVAAIVAGVYLPVSWRPASTIAVIAIGVVAEILVFAWPWLNWFTSTYTITNRRIITRKGVFTKTGHDIPLSRISDVAYEHSFIDRMFGCGTLVLQTSAADPLYLVDVPKVEKVHVQLLDLLFGMHSGAQTMGGQALGPDEGADITPQLEAPARPPVSGNTEAAAPSTNAPDNKNAAGREPLLPRHYPTNPPTAQ